MAAVDELAQLKRLILGQEQQSLERLQERVERPGTRAHDVAEVLPEAFELNAQNTQALSLAMRAPVEQCLSDSVRDDPHKLADVLFPVIGPAIRKAVAESISALNERINRALENSLSLQGLKWRMESYRSGVPLSDIILRDTFIYRVEQAFVIQRDSGLLIAHVARDGVRDHDSDAVSAMLSALQDFVRDSFQADEPAELDTIRVGGHTVWVFHGPEALTAALIQGQPPRDLRDLFQEVTENIHARHGTQIANYTGDQASMDNVQELLRPLLESERLRDNRRSRQTTSSPFVTILFAILVAILLGWSIAQYFAGEKRRALEQVFAASPGIELISLKPGKPLKIRALRDPLAADLESLLAASGYGRDDVAVEFVAFQSLDPKIVVRRIQQLFSAPETVELTIANDKLHVFGAVPASFEQNLRAFPLAVFGLSEVVFEQPQKVRESTGHAPPIDRLLESLRAETNAPQAIRLTVQDKTILVHGSGSYGWQIHFTDAALATGRFAAVDFEHFVVQEYEELSALVSHLDGQKFYFARNDVFVEDSRISAERLASDVQRLVEIDRLLGQYSVKFTVTGYADASGTPQQHAAVRSLRAQKIIKYLVVNGVSREQITMIANQPVRAADDSPKWRRAEIHVVVETVE